MTVINTNVSALYAQSSIAQNTRAMQQTMTQLSSGKRINGAADDAAGLSIAARLTSQVRGLNQAVRNANDAISMIQTAEGATDTITNMLQRMRELTIQAGNASNGTDDKSAAAAEYDQLAQEIERVATSTSWNGMYVLDGKFAGGGLAGTDKATATFIVDASANSSGNVQLDFYSMKTGAGAGTGIEVLKATAGMVEADGSLTKDVDATSASTLIGKIDASIKFVNQRRSDFGATINRLQYSVDNLTNIATNTAASRSRVEDVDYSTATSDLAKRNIIQQAATAMLAQANQQPQSVLQLLK
jgi:flagellin